MRCLSGRSLPPAAKDIEALAQTVEQVGWREHVEPGRRQFDRQRQTIETKADLGDIGGVLIGDGECGCTARALSLKSWTASASAIAAVASLGWGKPSAGTGKTCSALTRSVSRLVTTIFRSGASLKQLGYADCRRSHLLEVVEDQQHLSISEPGFQDVERIAPTGKRDVERPDHRLEGGIRITLGRQIDEEDSVAEVVHLLGGDLQSETCLPCSAWSGDGQQSRAPGLEHDLDRRQLVRSSQELGGLLREVVRPCLESEKRWKLRLETVLDQLIEVLGHGQVLETVCAQVTQQRARREPVLGEAGATADSKTCPP